MKKLFVCVLVITFCLCKVFADADDELFGGNFSDTNNNPFENSDDDLFGGSSDDDLFGGFGGDDDFFVDDGIEEYTDVSSKTDLSKGVIFENGSIKIGGNISAELGISSVIYADDGKNFDEHMRDTLLTPTLAAGLTVDARPFEYLRLYTKFGFSYPFKSNPSVSMQQMPNTTTITSWQDLLDSIRETKITISISDYFKAKELFTDLSINDKVFFRFGIHTVTWGAGYFFSPVSNMINASAINPEDPTSQVDGSLNLRAQVVFPGTQNCLWVYVIPSNSFANNQTGASYFRDLAFAAKGEIMIKDVELGVGAFWKIQNAPRIMLTGTGAIKKLNWFGEFVYSYGASTEWAENINWDNKTHIFQATLGCMYMWKDPSITVAAQYYFDSNDKDMTAKVTHGHNIALMTMFGEIFGNTDLTATVFAMFNIGKVGFTDEEQAALSAAGIDAKSLVNAITVSGMIYYSPFTVLKFGFGPYITWASYEDKPVVSLKLSFTLGGGKF